MRFFNQQPEEQIKIEEITQEYKKIENVLDSNKLGNFYYKLRNLINKIISQMELNIILDGNEKKNKNELSYFIKNDLYTETFSKIETLLISLKNRAQNMDADRELNENNNSKKRKRSQYEELFVKFDDLSKVIVEIYDIKKEAKIILNSFSNDEIFDSCRGLFNFQNNFDNNIISPLYTKYPQLGLLLKTLQSLASNFLNNLRIKTNIIKIATQYIPLIELKDNCEPSIIPNLLDVAQKFYEIQELIDTVLQTQLTYITSGEYSISMLKDFADKFPTYTWLMIINLLEIFQRSINKILSQTASLKNDTEELSPSEELLMLIKQVYDQACEMNSLVVTAREACEALSSNEKTENILIKLNTAINDLNWLNKEFKGFTNNDSVPSTKLICQELIAVLDEIKDKELNIWSLSMHI